MLYTMDSWVFTKLLLLLVFPVLCHGKIASIDTPDMIDGVVADDRRYLIKWSESSASVDLSVVHMDQGNPLDQNAEVYILACTP